MQGEDYARQIWSLDSLAHWSHRMLAGRRPEPCGDALMSFPAKFKGKCGECGDAFDVGEEVCYIDGTLVAIHEHGRPEDWELIGSKPENVCRRCYTVHAGECL